DVPVASSVDAYMIRVGTVAEKQGLLFSETIRDQLPQLKLQVNCSGGRFKSQFKKADKSGARVALIIGDDEAKNQQVAVKFLRKNQPQEIMSHESAITLLSTHL
ncbi:MAG: histidine--tRNA ligase, partial [Methylococcales bacterium]|nr:histidine--tRNA ligase [Methylococcales bacterium]